MNAFSIADAIVWRSRGEPHLEPLTRPRCLEGDEVWRQIPATTNPPTSAPNSPAPASLDLDYRPRQSLNKSKKYAEALKTCP